jgi:hypothetical protein
VIGVGVKSEYSCRKTTKQKEKKCRASAPFAAKNILRSRTLVPRSRSGAAGAACRAM